jgi:hypothetical protein
VVEDLKFRWQVLVLAVVLGVGVGLATGLLENQTGASIPENKYYGFPLFWRINNMNTGDTYMSFELFVDVAFWIIVFLVVGLVASKLTKN